MDTQRGPGPEALFLTEDDLVIKDGRSERIWTRRAAAKARGRRRCS